MNFFGKSHSRISSKRESKTLAAVGIDPLETAASPPGLPLDQFVTGSDVKKLFDPSPSLVARNSCLVTRRVNFIVGAILVQERRWSGLPHIRDGPIALRFPNSKFVYRLRLFQVF